MHNVGQQIRASCWLHIASDTPTDRQSYINFPNPHTELPLKTLVSLSLFFFKKKCARNTQVTLLPNRTPNGQPVCPVY